MKRRSISLSLATCLIISAQASAHPTTAPSDSALTDRIDSSVVAAYNRFEHSITAFGTPLLPFHAPEGQGLTGGVLSQNATFEQVLRLAAPVDIRERGGRSVQTDISIRGGSPDQTGILLGGIDFTDVRTGHQSHSLPIDADIVQEIRLLDGGNTGLSGAVNLIAGPGSEADYIRLHLAGGDHGYAYTHLSAAHTVRRAGTLRLFEAASWRRSDGYRPSTDFTNANLYARAEYKHPRIGTLDAQAGWQDRAFGANGFYSLKFPDQFEQTGTRIASLRWNRILDRWIFEAYASYRGNTDRFELIRGSEAAVPFNYHATRSYALYGTAAYVWTGGRTSISGTWHRGRIRSTVLGEPVSAPAPVPGASDRFFTYAKLRDWGDIALMHQKQGDRWALKAALEASFSPFGVTPLWSAGAAWEPADGWNLDVQAAKTLRLPTFTDLYYTAVGHVGNPDLHPEHATLFRTGMTYGRSAWSVTAGAWYRHSTDLIDWVRESADGPWMCSQITSLNTYGADLTAGWTTAGRLKSLSVMYAWMSSSKSAQGLISRYALDYMHRKAAATAELRLCHGLVLGANASWYDREGSYADASGEVLPYKPYFLLNANLSYTTGACRWYLDADNLTATRYFDFGGLEMPRLSLVAGLVITLL